MMSFVVGLGKNLKSEHHLSARDLRTVYFLTTNVKIKFRPVRRDSRRRNWNDSKLRGQCVSDDADVAMPLAQPPKHYTAQELFMGDREITIEHNGELYRLRITAKGGLLLTK
jgi:hemin uptake protein HemP